MTVTANGKTKEFKRAYAPALVEVSKITQSSNTMTKFELSVQTEEDDYKVSNLRLYSDDACNTLIPTDKSANDEITNDTVLNIEHVKDEGTNVRCVRYDVETDETTESEGTPASCAALPDGATATDAEKFAAPTTADDCAYTLAGKTDYTAEIPASTSSVVVPVKISATNYSDYFKVI